MFNIKKIVDFPIGEELKAVKEERIGVRLPPELRAELNRIAAGKNVSVSTLVRDILADYIGSTKSMNQLVREIHDEVIQLEGMLSIMHDFDQQVYATILGRTTPKLESEADKERAKKDKQKAQIAMKDMQTKAISHVLDGENVWGEASKKE